MKKAVGVLLILISIAFLQYFGFADPVILTSVPEFLHTLREVQTGGVSFAYFVLTLGNFFLAISSIFLCFGTLWLALDLMFSKEKDFTIVVTRNPMVLMSVGSGLFFGSMFCLVFSNMINFVLIDAILELLLAIAALDFTISVLHYLESDSRHFRFTIKLSKV